MSEHLVILLGGENDSAGRLRASAISRCEIALSLLQSDEAAIVLPTGDFGRHFNRSLTPHGAILADYLRSNGIAPRRILPWTRSSGTVEDALLSRRVVSDRDPSKVTIITSDFHMERARFIFQRIFRDRTIHFSPAPSAAGRWLLASERRKLRRLRAEWVDVPENSAFPEEVYENASDEQKHYDNLSLAVASGTVVVFSGVFALDLSKSRLGQPVSFLLAAVILACLLCLYDRACKTARTARRVLRYIEVAYSAPGFSTAYSRSPFAAGIFTIRTLVLIFGIAMIAFLLASALRT